MAPIRRITLFKIPSETDILAVLKAYDVLMATNLKDSVPYIVSCTASRVYNTSEPRSEGYTVAVQSVFASREDVEFYDKECPAHKELKKITTTVNRGLCTLLME